MVPPSKAVVTHLQPCQFTQDLKDEVHDLCLKFVKMEMAQEHFIQWETQQNGTLASILKNLTAMDERREGSTLQRLEDARLVSDKLDSIVEAQRDRDDGIKASIGVLFTAIETTHTLVAERDVVVQKQFTEIQKQIIALLVTLITIVVSGLVALSIATTNHLFGGG